MTGKAVRRTVTPIISAFRNFLRGRPIVSSLRYADALATRSPPHPEVPGGPYHKTSKIYYFTRDMRREVQPPLEILSAKRLTDGKHEATETLKISAPAETYNPK